MLKNFLWETFAITGDIEAYLGYKEAEGCQESEDCSEQEEESAITVG